MFAFAFMLLFLAAFTSPDNAALVILAAAFFVIHEAL